MFFYPLEKVGTLGASYTFAYYELPVHFYIFNLS